VPLGGANLLMTALGPLGVAGNPARLPHSAASYHPLGGASVVEYDLQDDAPVGDLRLELRLRTVLVGRGIETVDELCNSTDA